LVEEGIQLQLMEFIESSNDFSVNESTTGESMSVERQFDKRQHYLSYNRSKDQLIATITARR
jgi:hypothetical protein